MWFRSGLTAQVFALPLIAGGCNSRAATQQAPANSAEQAALLRLSDNATPVRLAADEAGGTRIGSGYVVAGRGTAIVFQRPAGPRRHCKG